MPLMLINLQHLQKIHPVPAHCEDGGGSGQFGLPQAVFTLGLTMYLFIWYVNISCLDVVFGHCTCVACRVCDAPERSKYTWTFKLIHESLEGKTLFFAVDSDFDLKVSIEFMSS